MKIEPPPAPVKVTIEAVVNPSEDPNKVSEAMRNLAGGADLATTRKGPRLVAESNDPRALETIYQKMRARRSLGVARRHLRMNASEGSTWICFNKQAAYVKTINICEDDTGSPLGDIKVSLRSGELDKIIDWLAPAQLD